MKHSFSEPMQHKQEPPAKSSRLRSFLSATAMVAGILVGLVGLALVSNQFGNTDAIGLPVIALSGFLFAFGFARFYTSTLWSLAIGILAAPLSLFLLLVLYWVAIVFISFTNLPEGPIGL